MHMIARVISKGKDRILALDQSINEFMNAMRGKRLPLLSEPEAHI